MADDPRLRLLVCGGRDYTDEHAAFRELDRIHQERGIALIIHGGARGADTIAGRWAAYNEVEVDLFPADWERHGKAAGPIRNKQMLDLGRPSAVLAFPGGRGTANMVEQANAAGIPVWFP